MRKRKTLRPLLHQVHPYSFGLCRWWWGCFKLSKCKKKYIYFSDELMWSKVRYVGSSIPLLEPRRSRIHPNLVSLWRNLFQAINMVPIDSKLFFLLCVLRIEVSKIIFMSVRSERDVKNFLKTRNEHLHIEYLSCYPAKNGRASNFP